MPPRETPAAEFGRSHGRQHVGRGGSGIRGRGLRGRFAPRGGANRPHVLSGGFRPATAATTAATTTAATTKVAAVTTGAAMKNQTAKATATVTATATKSAPIEPVQRGKNGIVPSAVDIHEAAPRVARFEMQIAGNKFEELKPIRELERQDAIKHGLIDDPKNRKALAHARRFVGTCLDMCPEFEREQREYQKNVERWEIDPNTGRIDRLRAVKAFHRPAAGNEQPLPSDVRPPAVLKRTLEYLIRKIVGKSDEPLESIHAFVRDRTRSIRQDFTLQNERGSIAIECHEQIARFHMICLHQLCEMKDFSAQQEMEQLRKVLQSLTEFYDDARQSGMECRHEPVFRAYHYLVHLRDQDMIRQAQALPTQIFLSQPVQLACRLIGYAQRSNEVSGPLKPQNTEAAQNNYSRLFKLVTSDQTPYLIACILETFFVDIRKGALKAMRKCYLDRQKPFPAGELAKILGCDNELQVAEICVHHNIEIEVDTDGKTIAVQLNNKSAWNESRQALRQQYSYTLVERKRGHQTYADIILGIAPSTLTDRTSSNKLTKEQIIQQPIVTRSTTLSNKRPFRERSPSPPSSILIDPPVKHKLSKPLLPSPSPAADENVEAISQDVFHQLVHGQIRQILYSVYSSEQICRHDDQIVELLAYRTYYALLRSSILSNTAESLATWHYDRQILYKAIRKITHRARVSLADKLVRERQMKESQYKRLLYHHAIKNLNLYAINE